MRESRKPPLLFESPESEKVQGSFVLLLKILNSFLIVIFRLPKILCIFAIEMQRLLYIYVWLKRIRHTCGFGIQSPTDYWLVRYVINEHWPYYQYKTLGKGDQWLTRKLGRLYFRLANWRQPQMIESDGYHDYFKAGCSMANYGSSTELIRITLEDDYQSRLIDIYNKVNDRTVLIVEGIQKDICFWQQIVADVRTGVTFDLYYCGIVLFDKKRHKQNYIINF